MCDRNLSKWLVIFATVMTVPLGSFLAQESPQSDETFDVEPPLLVPPGDTERGAEEVLEAPPDIGQLEQQLERAKKSAASAERLVKMGVLAKVEAEQRALRVVRLEAALANAQLTAAQEQVTFQQARNAAGQASKTDLDSAMAALARASAAERAATENYHQAQLDAAVLNLRRQRQLLAQGSAHKSDVARAEEKLATLQRGDQTSP